MLGEKSDDRVAGNGFDSPVFCFAETFSGHYCVSVACCLSLPRR
jgi:hypothetical protein